MELCLIRVRLELSKEWRKSLTLPKGYGGSAPEPFAFTIGAGEVIKGFVDSATV